MKNQSISFPTILLGCFSIGFLFWFYGDLICAPNAFMFNQTGDGLKNYFTYAYHIKYGASSTNFMGMNYPYGEHFLYTDCHPALAYFLKLTANIIPSISNYSVGILNVILLSAIFLSIWVYYFLLQELNVKKWFALIFSIGIFLMVPQVERIGGHLALSYSMAIPLSWLLLLKQQKSTGWFYTIVLFLNNLLWLFVHAYLGMIVLSFLLMYAFLQFCIQLVRKEEKPIKALVSIVLPIVLFYIFAKLTDQHIGRTNNPSGFFLYYAEFDNIVIPSYGPLWTMWKSLIPTVNLEGEGNAYVGLINVLLILGIIIHGIGSLFSMKWRASFSRYFQHKPLNLSLISAFIILLIAMGIPFVQFPDLLDYFPVVKQFRAIGRFSWPFFFVFMAFGAYQVQQLILALLQSKYRFIGITIIALVIFVPFFEAFGRQQEIAKNANGKSNLFDKSVLDKDLQELIDQTESDKYQAIFSLPFYHHGSESFERPRNDLAMHNTLIFSYHTGIPNISANLTRSSVPESKKSVQLITPNYYPKPIQKELNDTRPFLVIYSDNELTEYEEDILSRAKQITPMQNDFALYELEYSDLFKDQRQEVIQSFYNQFGPVITTDSLYKTDTTSFYYFDGFEKLGHANAFQGNGAYSGIKKGENRFTKFPPYTFEKDKTYQIKVWMYNGEQDALNLYFRLKVDAYDLAKDEWKNQLTLFPDKAEVIYGDWSLVEGEFKVDDVSNEIFISTIGKMNSKAALLLDNLIVMEKGLNVYKIQENNTLFYNNHLIKQPN
jgi:hypothetical protein